MYANIPAVSFQFQPIALERHIINGSTIGGPFPHQIHPSYYAAIIIAEAIGSSGLTFAYELASQSVSPPGGFTTIAGYAFLEIADLKRIVLLDYRMYTTGTRPSTSITLNLVGHSFNSMTIKRLFIRYVFERKDVF